MFRSLALILTASVALAAGRAPIAYTLTFKDAATHYVDVEAVIPTGGAPELTLCMPVWTPGSYLVREYARTIMTLEARSPAGAVLPLEKLGKNRWRVGTGGGAQVKLAYRLFARDPSVRGNWVEPDFAVINGAATFIAIADDLQRPYTVDLGLPASWATSQTPLAPLEGAHRYAARDFDQLVDSPIVAGSPLVDSFEVDGVRHTVVTLGGDHAWDNARAARNLRHLVIVQKEFWGGLPFREPYYFFNFLAAGRGGLEHTQSTVLGADRWSTRTRTGLNSWLSLASHEYFHLWNGKRLRPVELGPFDYEHEVYTRSLWVVEGITSYYQPLFLRRAGFTTREEYLAGMAGAISEVRRTPARLAQSLSDASFDTWIKTYRPDENSVNAHFSYYTGGSVAMLLLDAEIRRVTDGAKSLDDAIRAAYARYSGARGYTEAEFVAVVSEVAGHDLSGWIKRVVQTPGEWDCQPFLDWYGLKLEPAKADSRVSPNKLEPADAPRAWLGAETKVQDGLLIVSSVRAGTPAAAAGVSAGDELIGIDDYRVPPGQLAGRLNSYQAGDTVTLLVARRDHLLRLPVTFTREPEGRYSLKVRTDATPAQKARLIAWIGEGEPNGAPAAAPAPEATEN